MSNESPPDRSGKFERPKVECPKCGGTGKTSFPDQKREAQCGTCKGTGQVPG
jgi:DnaJ-class molecular chaperone